MTPPPESRGWGEGRVTDRAKRLGDFFLAALFFVTPFSKAGAEILFPLLLIAWLIGWRRPLQPLRLWEETRPAEWVWLSLSLYVFLCAFSVLYSSHRQISAEGFIGKTLEYGLMFLIAVDLGRRDAVPERCAKTLLAAAWFVVAYGFLQEWTIAHSIYQSTVVDPIRGKTLNYVRMVGPYENPNDLATFLMVTGLIAIDRLTGPLALRNRIQLTVLALFLSGCLIWVQSMGGLVGFAAGMGVLLLANLRRRRQRLWLVGGAFLAVVLFFTLTGRHIREILTLADVASRERIVMWKTALAMIHAKPLLGHGVNTFMANYNHYAGDATLWPAYAHNCFLQIAAETGLVGLGLFLLFIGALAALVWKALRVGPAPLLTGFAAALVAFLIQSFFDTNLYALRQAVLFWTLSGVTLGLALRTRRR